MKNHMSIRLTSGLNFNLPTKFVTYKNYEASDKFPPSYSLKNKEIEFSYTTVLGNTALEFNYGRAKWPLDLVSNGSTLSGTDFYHQRAGA